MGEEEGETPFPLLGARPGRVPQLCHEAECARCCRQKAAGPTGTHTQEEAST